MNTREQFEAAWRKEYPLHSSTAFTRSGFDPERYANTRVQDGWLMWQAARATPADHIGDAAEKVDAQSVPVDRLDKPAQVGNGRFGVGVKWSTVIGAAQRHHEYMNTPEKERDRIAMGKEFFERFGAPQAPQPEAQSVPLSKRLIAAIEGECDGLAINGEQASNILAYLQYGVPMDGVLKDAERYRKLRNADIDSVSKGGVFAGLTPDNVVINGEDLDIAVDLLIDAKEKS